MKIKAPITARKSSAGCEHSMINAKLNSFSEYTNEAISNLDHRKDKNSKSLQDNTTFHEKESLKLKENQHQSKKLYVGNFISCVTVNDIHKLFGIRLTKYLRDTCSVEMPLRSHDQSKGSPFITASQHA